jgi:hypothetical protein
LLEENIEFIPVPLGQSSDPDYASGQQRQQKQCNCSDPDMVCPGFHRPFYAPVPPGLSIVFPFSCKDFFA